jgi:hypothetical protein
MVDEDQGISRFFYKTISLQPMPIAEAVDLVESKLRLVASQAEEQGLELVIDPEIPTQVASLSGGHPHIVQLLGSHLIQHENDDPDNIIDAKDLVNSLRRICYEDRTRVYDSTVHMLEANGKLEALSLLLEGVPAGFPTRIDRKRAAENPGLTAEAVSWLLNHNVLRVVSPDYYGLVDEFLRIRLLFDEANRAEEIAMIERRMIRQRPVGAFRPSVEEDYEEGIPSPSYADDEDANDFGDGGEET